MPQYPDLDSLALLVRVAESGSLGRAARATGLSQPSASARIAALERRLGVQLLVRSTRGSSLTSAGRLVVEWSGAVMVAADELTQGAAALRARESAHLTVAASMTIAEYLLPDWLVALRTRDPEITVQLQVANSTAVIAAVRGGRVPLGFVEGPTVPRDMTWRSVGVDRLIVVVSPQHPWAERTSPLPLHVLLATPLLLREPDSGTRQALEAAVGGAGMLSPPALELSTTTAIRSAAAGGSAPAVLSELTVAADLSVGRLVHIDVAGLAVRRRLRAVWQRGRQLPSPAARLVSLARPAGA